MSCFLACESSCGSSPLARGLPRVAQQADGLVGIIPARAGFTGRRVRVAGGAADHPRSRGVYAGSGGWGVACAGSSPFARGLHGDVVAGDHSLRIIPARAGFTRLCFVRTFVRRDHPRSRGVYATTTGIVVSAAGSSPLARGLQGLLGLGGGVVGIIPARAGFTAERLRLPRAETDHPRSRGVYRLRSRAHGAVDGSSPLARGLPPLPRERPGARGIIPARAGFT